MVSLVGTERVRRRGHGNLQNRSMTSRPLLFAHTHTDARISIYLPFLLLQPVQITFLGPFVKGWEE